MHKVPVVSVTKNVIKELFENPSLSPSNYITKMRDTRDVIKTS